MGPVKGVVSCIGLVYSITNINLVLTIGAVTITSVRYYLVANAKNTM